MPGRRLSSSPAPSPGRGAVAACAAALALAIVAAGLGSSDRADRAAAQGKPAPPNIVVVMTDDQDAASIRVMDRTNRRLTAHGTSFRNAYVTTPLCCPSRATFLTGEYAHNHGVHDSGGGFSQFRDAETALPVELRAAGYRTALIGKYLNGYGADDPVPPGWDEWQAAVDKATSGYEYDLMGIDGETTHYGSAPSDYRTDVYADAAVDFLERAHDQGGPFFVMVAPGVPHESDGEPPKPAPRHEGAFTGEPLPRPPSFNERDLSDKPRAVRSKPFIGRYRRAHLARLHRGRLASLLAVDELVGRVVRTLEATGELENTVVAFTSDNGYLLGEHRLTRKRWLYEESARVPLVIRGPGFPGAARDQVVANLDLAPTFLDLAGAQALGGVDGTSLLPFAADGDLGQDRALLLENFSERSGGGSRAVVTQELSFAENPAGSLPAKVEDELYDLEADPYQLQSLHDDPEHDKAETELRGRLRELEDCAGATCRGD